MGQSVNKVWWQLSTAFKALLFFYGLGEGPTNVTKVPLKLNPMPKTARMAMMTVQNDLTKTTQNHSKRRKTGHYNTQMTNLDPEAGSLHKNSGVGTSFGKHSAI